MCFFFGMVRYFLFLDSRSGRDNEVTDSTEYHKTTGVPCWCGVFERYICFFRWATGIICEEELYGLGFDLAWSG